MCGKNGIAENFFVYIYFLVAACLWMRLWQKQRNKYTDKMLRFFRQETDGPALGKEKNAVCPFSQYYWLPTTK